MEKNAECNAEFTFERIRMMGGFDGKECKIYPRLTVTEKNMFISYGLLLLSGIDVLNDTYFVTSTDGGKTFKCPKNLPDWKQDRTESERFFRLVRNITASIIKNGLCLEEIRVMKMKNTQS